jgi:hypothetical protein
MRSLDLYSSRSIIQMSQLKQIRWAGQVACRGDKKNVCKILVGKSKGKMPLGSAGTEGR